MRIDDSLDVFAEHGIGGIVGLIFNALFGADYIIGLDGVNNGVVNGGWPNHNYKQLYIQVAYICATSAYTFVVSALIAKAIDLVPGLRLRATEEAELIGMDDDQLGEFAYDYVEVRRDFLAWTPAKEDPHSDAHRFIPQHGIEEHQNLANTTGQRVLVSHADNDSAVDPIQQEKVGVSVRAPAKEQAIEAAAKERAPSDAASASAST